MAVRIVLHLDMDAFFAAIEQRERPELRGRPVLVGRRGARGVVMTCSYEARRFGVRSAMSSLEAERRCPDAAWVAPRTELYTRVSWSVFEIVRHELPVVEQVSIDEAYGDLTGFARDVCDARSFAERLKRRIASREMLTASVGLAENRFLAKVASDMEKPNGLVVVPPHAAERMLGPLSVRVIPGVGPKLGDRLRATGIVRIADITAARAETLVSRFGRRTATYLRLRAAGTDETPVRPSAQRQQISEERTYLIDLIRTEEVDRELLARAASVTRTLRGRRLLARSIVLKVRDSGYRTLTRSMTLREPTDLSSEVFRAAKTLFHDRVELGGAGIRLLGVGLKDLVPAHEVPPKLFDDPERRRARTLERAADDVSRRFGKGAIGPARLIERSPAARTRPATGASSDD